MKLIRLMFTTNRSQILLAALASIVGGVLGVYVIAFINSRFIQANQVSAMDAMTFAGLLMALFAGTVFARWIVSRLGHRLVYEKRIELMKRLLDTDVETIDELGSARLMAALSTDIKNMTAAFVEMPAMLYGLTLILSGFAYIAWLSPSLFLATISWLTLSIFLGVRLLSFTNQEIKAVRGAEDDLFADYEATLSGRKELALNPARAKKLYQNDYVPHAAGFRHHILRADTCNSINANWLNTMLLAAIGLVFYLSNGLGWESTAVASTFAVTILFLRGPLISLVAGIPSFISGNVSVENIQALELAAYRPDFISDEPRTELTSAHPFDAWQSIRFNALTFRYKTTSAQEGTGFAVGPLDITINRGDLIFLVGGNGSGKSTMMRLLTGMYRADSGHILVDQQPINDSNLSHYRGLFSAVFSDFYLFRQLIQANGQDADAADINRWLQQLNMDRKVSVQQSMLDRTDFSQGQKKRLALMVAALESKSLLVLDEWAADQDPHFRHVFYHDMLPALRAAGHTVIAVTHDDRYFHLADRMYKMELGQLSLLDATTGSAGMPQERRDVMASTPAQPASFSDKASASV